MRAHRICLMLFLSAVLVAMFLPAARGEIPEELKTPNYRITNGNNKEDRDKAMAAVTAAVPTAQKDPTRPVYHFRPPAQWMNDICGAIRYKDYYHVFYQFNPFSGDRWGDDYTLWAHARSKDLVHWEDLPWAFLPMKDRGERRCPRIRRAWRQSVQLRSQRTDGRERDTVLPRLGRLVEERRQWDGHDTD